MDCYSLETTLFPGIFCLDSATGMQQGDPLRTALFALAIYEVTSHVKFDLNVWYLHDVLIETHGPCSATLVATITSVRNTVSSVGLETNSKCKLLINHTNNNELQTRKFFQEHFPYLSIPDPKQ